MDALNTIAERYRQLAHGMNHGVGSVMLLVVRLVMGPQWLLNGVEKFQSLDSVSAYFASLNIPAPALCAPLVAGVELVGGLLLLLGLGSRLSMIPLAITMIVALLTAELPAIIGNFPPNTFSTAQPSLFAIALALVADPAPLLMAPAFHFLVPALLVLVLGPGHLSADGLIGWLWKRRMAEAS